MRENSNIVTCRGPVEGNPDTLQHTNDGLS